eukprot:3580344-Prymnesium_polylepis.2
MLVELHVKRMLFRQCDALWRCELGADVLGGRQGFYYLLGSARVFQGVTTATADSFHVAPTSEAYHRLQICWVLLHDADNVVLLENHLCLLKGGERQWAALPAVQKPAHQHVVCLT